MDDFRRKSQWLYYGVAVFFRGYRRCRVVVWTRRARDTSTLQLEANIAKEAPEEEVIVEADAVDITGLVTDNDGAPLADVHCYPRNATQAITDKKGMFTLQVAPGLYEFTAIKQGYASRTFSNIAVPLDGALVMPMVKAGLTSEALTVSAPRIEGGTASLLSERREVNVVADVLGAEQMSKSETPTRRCTVSRHRLNGCGWKICIRARLG